MLQQVVLQVTNYISFITCTIPIINTKIIIEYYLFNLLIGVFIVKPNFQQHVKYVDAFKIQNKKTSIVVDNNLKTCVLDLIL